MGEWKNPLVKKGTVVLEMGETTPFVFNDRLYRLENWQKFLAVPSALPGERFMEDEVRIWDVDSGGVVSVPFTGYSFGFAFVWDGRVYVFATKHVEGRSWRTCTEIDVVSSSDLIHWTTPKPAKPEIPNNKFQTPNKLQTTIYAKNVYPANTEPNTVINAEQVIRDGKPDKEHLFNTAVCRDTDRFVLLYETDDPQWPAFTFKYCESRDLINWKRIPDAVYGRDKYVGGPALYFEGEWFYTLYLEDLGGYSGGTWETRITRSRDLVHWEDAPSGRPFLAPDSSRIFHYDRGGKVVRVKEINASDAELCYWKGKTLVYFGGGDQQTSGDLQQAEFDGTPRELLEYFYE